MQSMTRSTRVSATVVLDSGILLFCVNENDDPAEQDENECKVGFFAPTVIVYGDGLEVERFKLKAGDDGQVVDVVHVVQVDGKSTPKDGKIRVTKQLRRDILRKEDIKYGHLKDLPKDTNFEHIFRFTTGIMRPSSVKVRKFKEMKGDPPVQLGSFPCREIAHDIVFEYDLGPGEDLQMNIGETFNWSTDKHSGVTRRFDIEIIADHGTAERYYREAFGLKEGYIVPNQGDPPPIGGRP